MLMRAGFKRVNYPNAQDMLSQNDSNPKVYFTRQSLEEKIILFNNNYFCADMHII